VIAVVEIHACADAYKMTNTHKHPAVTLDGIGTMFEISTMVPHTPAHDAKHAGRLAHLDVRLLL
jgi:hypothetical protein